MKINQNPSRPRTAAEHLRAVLADAEPCTHHPELSISQSREHAAEWWHSFQLCAPGPRREHLRWMGRNDLYFLLRYILSPGLAEKPPMDNDFHFARCREIVAAPTGHIDLWHREAGKSLLQTFARNIQEILRNPEITIGIFSHTRPMAKAFLRTIKIEFEKNDLLRDLYPDVLYRDPLRQSPKWSDDEGIIVKRRLNRNTATVEAWGLIDGQPTSKRFDILHYDDIISRGEITSAMIAKATQEFENSLALTATDPPQVRYLATFQEIGDTTQQLLDRQFLPVRRYPVCDAEGTPVLFSPDKVAFMRRSMSPKTFALQYLLDPIRATADEQIGFDLSWVRKIPLMPERATLHVYMVVDPAGKGPHANSRFALWVAGIDVFKVWHLLDGVADKLGLVERADATIRMLKKWQPMKIGYETYSMQGDVEYLRERLRADGLSANIVQLGGMKDKDRRIEQLQPLYRGGKIVYPQQGIPYTTVAGESIDLVTEIIKELGVWPFGKQKDLLDAQARLCDPALGVVAPRGYGSLSVRTGNPWRESAGQGSWLSQ